MNEVFYVIDVIPAHSAGSGQAPAGIQKIELATQLPGSRIPFDCAQGLSKIEDKSGMTSGYFEMILSMMPYFLASSADM